MNLEDIPEIEFDELIEKLKEEQPELFDGRAPATARKYARLINDIIFWQIILRRKAYIIDNKLVIKSIENPSNLCSVEPDEK